MRRQALLITRCGCQRIIDVLVDPSPPSIKVLIEPPNGWQIPTGERTDLVQTRTFHRVGRTAHHVIYEEEITS